METYSANYFFLFFIFFLFIYFFSDMYMIWQQFVWYVFKSNLIQVYQ